MYGALLNSGCRFFDQRIGQSVTLTGRSIVQHMSAQLNLYFIGKYEYIGGVVQYNDTDSLYSHSLIETNKGKMTIEELYERCTNKVVNGDKEYSCDPSYQVLTYCPTIDKAIYKRFNYVYRHKVSKKKWRITDQNNNTIIVTEDHSVMVERDGKLMEVKPSDILVTDILLTVKDE